jgi:hypothetical protein
MASFFHNVLDEQVVNEKEIFKVASVIKEQNVQLYSKVLDVTRLDGMVNISRQAEVLSDLHPSLKPAFIIDLKNYIRNY